jgi:hypothetical protein
MNRLQVLSTILFLFLAVVLQAQKFEIQIFTGPSVGSVKIKQGPAQKFEGAIYNDSSYLRTGLAFNMKIHNRFRLRLGADYYQYRTYFHTPESEKNWAIGNLYNEKFTISVLPELRFNDRSLKKIHWQWYLFAGLNLGLEQDKNWSEYVSFQNSYDTALKPDISTGLSGGVGVHAHYKHFGLMLENRFDGVNSNKEKSEIGDLRYFWYSCLLGLTFQF